jgi:hypothetical protein
MNYITGQDRHQMRLGSPADAIGSDNPLQFIAAFVDKIDLAQIQIDLKLIREEGHQISLHKSPTSSGR